MRRLRECQVALMFLTRLPVGRISGDCPTLADCRWAFPLVGLPLGVLGWAVFAGAQALGAAPLMAGLLVLMVLALVTGALHHDGLADYADGMGGGRDRDHALEIMRDSRIGSYGVLALILCMGLMAAALAQAPVSLTLFCAIAMVSRGAMLALLLWLPAARADGLGTMASGVANWSMPVLGLVAVFVVACTGITGVALIAVTAIVATLIARAAHRKIGGQTGDVLGATQLMTETACWVVVALV